MAKIHLYVEAADATYQIACRSNGHASMRADERFYDYIIDDDYLVGRLFDLMQSNDELADVIVNCVRIGENFVIEDFHQNFSMAIYHKLNLLTIGTVHHGATGLKKYDGQKVIRILSDGSFLTYTFNKQKPRALEVSWA
jgi:hypothetical protein